MCFKRFYTSAYVQIVVQNLSYVKFPFKLVVMRRLCRLLSDLKCLYITITLQQYERNNVDIVCALELYLV